MALLIIITALLAVAAYIAANRLRRGPRLLLAAMVFIVPPAVLTALVVYHGDRPQGCYQTIDDNTFEPGPVQCD